MPAYVDFTYARATPNSWQPADISLDYSHPLVYGNHLLLQNVHLIDGTFATYTMQATRQVIFRDIKGYLTNSLTIRIPDWRPVLGAI